MRLGISAVGLRSHHSGLGVYTRELVRALSVQHDEYVVYSSHRPGGAASPAPSPLPSPDRWFLSKLWQLAVTQFALPARMKRDGVSVCLSPSPLHGLLFPPAPQVLIVHDLIPLVCQGEQPRVQRYFRYVVPLILQRSAVVVAVSKSTARDLADILGVEEDKVRVIYNGYDRRLFHPNVDETAVMEKYNLSPYILYVGDQLPHKNLRTLLEAFAKTEAIREGYRLVIAGRKDPRYYPELRARAVELGITGKVVFLGYVPRNDLPGLYKGADVFAYISHYEGFGLPPVEALACGTAVVASNTSSLPEVVGSAAALVPPDDTAQVAAALDRLLGNPQLRRRLVQLGQNHVKKFSWNVCAEQMLKVCRKVAQ